MDYDQPEDPTTYDDEVAEWWAWHMAESGEPYGTEGPPLRATITVDPGDRACVYLKWDAWPVTTEDYDLGVFDQSGTAVAASSAPV